MENVAQHYNWSKFYWNDWKNDSALQACDMASQGLWINLLRLMFHSEKPGYLQINGKPMTALHIAKCTGFDRRSIEKKLASNQQAASLQKEIAENSQKNQSSLYTESDTESDYR